MALSGSLKEFAPADVLQLVGRQRMTGMLAMRRRSRAVDFWFKNGTLAWAQSVSREQRERLGQMLVDAGVISEAQLEAAVEQHVRTKRRLGMVLLVQGIVSAEDIEKFVQLQLRESIYNVFLWRDGTYDFTPRPVPPPEPGAVLDIRWEQLLMEGIRRADEWPRIREVITSPELTFNVTAPLPAPGATPEPTDEDLERAFLAEDGFEDEAVRSEITEHERLLYSLAKPNVSVQQLINRSWLGEFETCSCLARLVRGGYLEARHEGEDVDF
ncbi:MAG: DUF4388 domain-containing protein [Myxococcota bacterium]